MHWSNGTTGVFLSNNNAGSRREEYAFHGPGETCRITEPGLQIEKGGAISKAVFPLTGDGFAAEHDEFLQAIRARRQPRHRIPPPSPPLFPAPLIHNAPTRPPHTPR